MDVQAEAVEFCAFDNSYARLPERFFTRLKPTPVAAPRLVRLNTKLALDLGLDPERLATPEGVEMLAGNLVPQGGEPLAMAYAGHQFGTFVPQLGDGRAILLGEVIDRAGMRRDIQLKGAGPTPYSRRGDGRAALGPVLREYIVSEAMAALEVPTTRALAAVTTGEPVWRETTLPGAVLTRVASSHIRVGTFQFFAARRDWDAVRRLADHVIARHYPEAASAANPYRALLDQVISRQAALIAKWLLVGFIHGVMNTDNMSIAGETIDYGPAPSWTRITLGRSTAPSIRWGAMLTEISRTSHSGTSSVWRKRCCRCLQRTTTTPSKRRSRRSASSPSYSMRPTPRASAASSACWKHSPTICPWHKTCWIAWPTMAPISPLSFASFATRLPAPRAIRVFACCLQNSGAFDEWAARWRRRLAQEGGEPTERRSAMRAVNPAFIPRNHLVEEAIIAAVNDGDFSAFERLLSVVSVPYEDQPAFGRYADPPRPDQVVHETFCGT